MLWSPALYGGRTAPPPVGGGSSNEPPPAGGGMGIRWGLSLGGCRVSAGLAVYRGGVRVTLPDRDAEGSRNRMVP